MTTWTRLENGRTIVECHFPYLKAVLLDGVDCDVQLSDKPLNELTGTDDYLLTWLNFFFFSFYFFGTETSLNRPAQIEFLTSNRYKNKKAKTRERKF